MEGVVGAGLGVGGGGDAIKIHSICRIPLVNCIVHSIVKIKAILLYN